MKTALVGVQLALCVLIFFLSDVAQGVEYVLTRNLVEELLETFGEMGNRDDFVTLEELEIAENSTTPPLPHVALQQLIEAAAGAGLGMLNKYMYFTVMGRFCLQEELSRVLFDVIENNGDCRTPIQVRAALARVVNLSFTDQRELDYMIQTAGFDSEGRFNLTEFMNDVLNRVVIDIEE